ncbi:endonuclease/exonuclease/phosphatase family protein [Cesiribacter andamanensis]|uniref:Endonuclease/exonuclease/phosphatase domain-containing protein n=1 Tax=Cesiribacter andamanensis AMV16 TaxID=1279009 RepID=M7NSI2_9BACT|nr:endonuclease/exonuclease/phosphatase family protein [Cesiribacter andamanensis]EMR04650.1 hypothetical protein ADICEAN_00253 [Cesiribacter andamanensis AMV16]
MKALSVLLSSALFLSILALQVSPQFWWGIGVLAAAAPLLWGGTLLFVLLSFLRPSWWMAAPVGALLLGMGVFFDTLSFPGQKAEEAPGLEVLSYNLSHFNRPRTYLWPKDSGKLEKVQELQRFMDWTAGHPAAIKCFQEFYTYPQDPYFDADARLRAGGWQHAHLWVDTLQVNKSVFGLAIYSKYPILASGVVFQGSTSFNKGIWADIATPEGDTLRVINVHLESAQLQRTRRSSGGKKETLRNMLWVFRESMLHRSEQADKVLAFARSSPHPVLICGDFNSTPYSYTYKQLDKDYQNAFRKKGSGFGFTLNHPKLFFYV